MSTVQQSSQPQQQSPDAKKVGSDGEDFSDTANETGTFELCSDANKTATSSSHQDSEYDTASDSQSSDEADPLQKSEVVGDSGGGGDGGDGGDVGDGNEAINEVEAETNVIIDGIPIEECRQISHEENDVHDDADGEADDDEESLNRRGRRGSRSADSEDDDDDDDRSDDDIRSDEESESDNGSIILDLERQRGDGEEEQNEDAKKVDDDEDRSNPQYIPKRGVFYEHDDRTADDPDANSAELENGDDEEPATPAQKKPTKKTSDRWAHDFYDESEQAPKSRSELVNSYGYDIRNEDGPPKTRRNRRYNRGPSKYTRKWEDESAYAKQSLPAPRNPRPEDFPELGSKVDRRNRSSQIDREEKENKSRQNYQNDDDNQNYAMRRRNSNHQLNDRRDSDRRDNDRRDSDRRDSDRRDSDRRDNSRSRRHVDRYPSGHGSRNDLDDRRRNKERGFKSNRPIRNTMEFKNQNRNKNSDYEVRGNSGGMYNRNNTGNHSESRPQHHHQHEAEHVESISFTNSKLNNNSNRYSNVEYSNVGSMQGREYAMSQLVQDQKMQPTQNQQAQPQRFQIVSNEIPINLESSNQMANQQNSQNTLLTTNHSLPISSSVIAATGAAPLNQQALHGQAINQVQQQPMGHIQAAGHVKRYSNQRQRTGLENQTQPQAQTQQHPMNVVIQQQQPQQPTQQPPNPLQAGSHQTPQQNVVPNVSAPAQFQPNFFPNEYPAINQLYVSDIRQQPAGPAAGYLQQGAPPSVGASVGVVPQMMNFVAAHPPMQPAPVVQPVPNAQVVAPPQQGQYPPYPTYAGVQNYNSASGITYYAPQTQPPPRPILSQRRHKNAIPIMAPPERSNKNSHGSRSSGGGNGSHMPGNNDSNNNSDQQQQASTHQSDNVAENIDHILDNMFVQRPHPYQSATGLVESTTVARKDSTPPADGQTSHIDVSGNAYSQEHDSTATTHQSNDDTVNSEQVAASFGDMNISVAIQANQ